MASSKPNPFRYFNSSPEVIRLAVMSYSSACTRSSAVVLLNIP
jgi:hypothetical protein